MGKSLGWWVEDSLVDRLDKSLSLLVFTMSLGTTAEVLLSVPGTWFGLPTPAWGLAPLAITFYSEFAHLPGTADYVPAQLLSAEAAASVQSGLVTLGLGSRASASFVALALVPTALWLATHVRYLVKGRFIRAYTATKYLMAPAMQVPILIAHHCDASFSTGAWFVIAWVVAETVGFVLKVSSARRRPRVSPAIAQQLASVPRAFPEVQTMLMVGESTLESFPSGDTIGAAVFSAQLLAMGAPAWTAVFGLTTAFCRVYFHAHHVLDVAAGLVIGFATVRVLPALLPMHSTTAWHEGAALVAFIGFHIVANRFKPELPVEFQVKGRKGF